MAEGHRCHDSCRLQDARWVDRERNEMPSVWPEDRSVLRIGVRPQHVCGSHCRPPDPPTPVRLDWRAPDRYDRTPVRCRECGGWMGAGMRHHCGRGVREPRPAYRGSR